MLSKSNDLIYPNQNHILESGISTLCKKNLAIRASHISKRFEIYEAPHDRLKQFVFPKINKLAGRKQKNYYREFWALRDISFEINQGETIGVIGRNGSGKSSLLQIICRTLSPTTGFVETRGRIAALLELGVGFNQEYTGRENIYLNGAILGLSKAEIDARFDDIAAFADIGNFIDQPVKTYSSGMYVRLAFSISINVAPDILIIDEALSVGDARFQAKCMKQIKNIQQNGTTILFVSHDVSAVRILCERALWLDSGMLRMNGKVFPVTGNFMEYLFSSDASKIEPATKKTATTSLLNNGSFMGQELEKNNLSIDYDNQPVTHWGSHIGCICCAGIYYSTGIRGDVIKLGEEIVIRIAFKLPVNADRHALCVAFSIKDLKGSDLIVSSTHDWNKLLCSGSGNTFLVNFRFKNPLVTGQYLLVATIEDRSSPAIHYYEYLEGAHYFSSVTDTRLFGIFQPDIQQEMVETHE